MKKTDWFEWRKQVFSCRECSNATKVWLGAVATFADEFGFCYPNQSQVAERMGRDTRGGLHTYATQAENCGHIVRGSKMTSEGKKSSNYTLRVKHHASQVNEDASGVKHHASQGEAPQSTNTSNNTITNSSTNTSNREEEVKEKQDASFSLDGFARVGHMEMPKYTGQEWMERSNARQAQINAEILAEFGEAV